MIKLTKLVIGRRFGEGVELTQGGEVVGIVRIENNPGGGGVRAVIYAPRETKIERVGALGERPLTTK